MTLKSGRLVRWFAIGAICAAPTLGLASNIIIPHFGQQCRGPCAPDNGQQGNQGNGSGDNGSGNDGSGGNNGSGNNDWGNNDPGNNDPGNPPANPPVNVPEPTGLTLAFAGLAVLSGFQLRRRLIKLS